MTEIHWTDQTSTKIGSTMNIARFGRKTKIACAHYA